MTTEIDGAKAAQLGRHPRGAAIRSVALRIAHDALAYYGEDGDEWEGYPEIGEADWAEVVDAVRSLAPTISTGTFIAAYDELTRAALADTDSREQR